MITAYMVEDSCEYLCEKCVRPLTSRIEFEILTGEKLLYEIEYWPVRNRDGSTKISPRGAVVMEPVKDHSREFAPHTFKGTRIWSYMEYSFEEEYNGVYCESCDKEIIPPYKATCYACGETMLGELAARMDLYYRRGYCERCLEKLPQVLQFEEKIDQLCGCLAPAATGKRARIALCERRYEKEVYFEMEAVKRVFEEADGPREFQEYVASELEKYEYLAHRDGGPALALFQLYEKINEFTYIAEEIDERVGWDDLDEVEKMREDLEHFNQYGEWS